MRALAAILSAFVETMAPDGNLVRLRLRTTLDMVITLVVTLLAVVLTVGYQVIGRWSRRQARDD